MLAFPLAPIRQIYTYTFSRQIPHNRIVSLWPADSAQQSQQVIARTLFKIRASVIIIDTKRPITNTARASPRHTFDGVFYTWLTAWEWARLEHGALLAAREAPIWHVIGGDSSHHHEHHETYDVVLYVLQTYRAKM